jgi:hypothetical protein
VNAARAVVLAQPSFLLRRSYRLVPTTGRTVGVILAHAPCQPLRIHALGCSSPAWERSARPCLRKGTRRLADAAPRRSGSPVSSSANAALPQDGPGSPTAAALRYRPLSQPALLGRLQGARAGLAWSAAPPLYGIRAYSAPHTPSCLAVPSPGFAPHSQVLANSLGACIFAASSYVAAVVAPSSLSLPRASLAGAFLVSARVRPRAWLGNTSLGKNE